MGMADGFFEANLFQFNIEAEVWKHENRHIHQKKMLRIQDDSGDLEWNFATGKKSSFPIQLIIVNRSIVLQIPDVQCYQ